MHVSVGTVDFIYVGWTTTNLNLVEPLVMGTRTWSFSSVVSKYLDYTQYYMMLLEQCGHIVAKFQATFTWLGEDQIMLTRSRDWTTLLSSRKTHSALHFQLCRLLKQYVLPCTSYWAGRYKRVWEVGNFYWRQSSGILSSSSKRIQTHTTSVLVHKKLARNYVEQWTFVSQWAFKHSS